METIYSVAYTRHNATTNAWAYKVELGTPSKDEAEKKYHALLGEYIGGETFDHVSVIMYDSNGAFYESKTWRKTAKVEE